ncbi:MAG: response regulator transcription factor [Acidobacteria bacterium]|nr:response regulator transcription factor [Acidobacteriota bacterium]
MAAQKKIKLLLGDPRPAFRAGLKLLLSSEKDVALIGEVEAADQVVKKVTALKPQVILIHSQLSEFGGRNLLLQVQRNFPRTRMLVMATSEDEEGSIRALRISTVQLVPRQAAFKQVLQWILRAETNGSTAVPAAGATATSSKSGADEAEGDSPLSSRERQVVELVSQGFKNREIAQRMFISEQTVKNHLHNVFDKLGVSDRLELALYAIHKQMQGGL